MDDNDQNLPSPGPNQEIDQDTESDGDSEFGDDEDEEVPIVVIGPAPRPQEGQGASTLLKRPGENDEEIQAEQPAPKRPARTDHGTINENLVTIRQAIQQMMGQSFTGIAENLLRNEAALSTTVESLRRALTAHQGHLEPSWEEFLTIIGPPRPTPPPPNPAEPGSSSEDAANQPSTSNPPPTGPQPLTEATAKEILRNLGHVFELFAALVKKLGYGEQNVTSGNVNDNNRVAYVISQVMNQIADMLQYTYRQKLHTIAKNFGNQSTKSKERIETVIAKAREDQANSSPILRLATRPLPYLQVLPAITFPVMDQPQIRYRIAIPPDDLMTNLSQLVQANNTSNNDGLLEQSMTPNFGEENLLLKFETLEIINGSRTTVVNFNAHDINFRLYQTYISQGWVDAHGTDPPGQYVRALEFFLANFKTGSIQHEIKAKARSEKLASTEGQSHQIEITVSGVLEGAYTTGSAIGQRIEFVFILPPHLSMKHVNDVGVRDGVLRIQFAK